MALREAKREIDRNGIKTNAKLVWVITDGISNVGGNPVAEANHLKDAGMFETLNPPPIGAVKNIWTVVLSNHPYIRLILFFFFSKKVVCLYLKHISHDIPVTVG